MDEARGAKCLRVHLLNPLTPDSALVIRSRLGNRPIGIRTAHNSSISFRRKVIPLSTRGHGCEPYTGCDPTFARIGITLAFPGEFPFLVRVSCITRNSSEARYGFFTITASGSFVSS